VEALARATRDVVTVGPGTPVETIARQMVDHRISGMPVVEPSGQLVGIVTDGDLYRRAELATERHRLGWLELFWSAKADAIDYVASHGRTAADVMTADVFAVEPETSLRQVADLLEAKHIRRVPVVADGKVVGIVSRANLVQAFAAVAQKHATDGLSDRRIRDLVIGGYRREAWGQKEGNVIVTDGVVHLWGFVGSEAEVTALRLSAEAIPGVVGFEDHSIRSLGYADARLRHRSTVTVLEAERVI
jgi:CBS domain-containing protein